MSRLKERRLHLLPGQDAGTLLAGLTSDPVAVGHVADHWHKLLRLVTSIRSGTDTASAMLRRLSAYLRRNGLALALREVGWIECPTGCATSTYADVRKLG